MMALVTAVQLSAGAPMPAPPPPGIRLVESKELICTVVDPRMRAKKMQFRVDGRSTAGPGHASVPASFIVVRDETELLGRGDQLTNTALGTFDGNIERVSKEQRDGFLVLKFLPASSTPGRDDRVALTVERQSHTLGTAFPQYIHVGFCDVATIYPDPLAARPRN